MRRLFPHAALFASSVALLCALAFGAPAPAHAEPPAALQAAQEAGASGDLERADTLYLTACPALDAAGPCLLEAGRLWLNVGLYARALPWLEQARRADAMSIDARVAYGVALDGLGRNEEALRVYRQALLLEPGHPDALFNLGRLELITGDLERAEATLRDLIARVPDHWQACNNLGLVLLERGQPAAALSPLRRALKLQPDDPGILYNIGRVWDARGEHRRALDLYDRALLRWGPGDLAAVPLHYSRGNALFALGRYDDAASAYRDALRLDSEHGGAQLNLGAALANLGRYDESLAALRQAAQLGVGDQAAYRQIAAVHIQAKDWPGALQALREAQRLGAADATTFSMLIQVHDALGDPDAAREARREACRLGVCAKP